MDERVTIPQGAALPEEMPAHFVVPEDLVAPDIMSTGEVSLLPPERPVGKSREDKIKTAFGLVVYLAVLALLVFEPQLFGPHSNQGRGRNRAAANDGAVATGGARCAEADDTACPTCGCQG